MGKLKKFIVYKWENCEVWVNGEKAKIKSVEWAVHMMAKVYMVKIEFAGERGTLVVYKKEKEVTAEWKQYPIHYKYKGAVKSTPISVQIFVNLQMCGEEDCRCFAKIQEWKVEEKIQLTLRFCTFNGKYRLRPQFFAIVLIQNKDAKEEPDWATIKKMGKKDEPRRMPTYNK